MYIIEIAEKEGFNLKITDAFIEDILINFKTNKVLEIILFVKSYNFKLENEDAQTNLINKYAKEIIQIGNANRIDHYQDWDQDSNQSDNKRESNFEKIKEVKDEDEENVEIKHKNFESKSDEYIEHENF